MGSWRLIGTRQGRWQWESASYKSTAGEVRRWGGVRCLPAQGRSPSRFKHLRAGGARRVTGTPGRQERAAVWRSPLSPPQLPNPGREPEGSAPPREGARAAGTKAIGPEPPAPPRHHLVGICGGGSWHPPWGSGPAPPAPHPPTCCARSPRSPSPRAAKFAFSEPGLDADGPAAMFAPRLMDFQKTKYAR